MKILKHLMFLLPMLFITCSDSTNPLIPGINPANIIGSWTNSFEEEKADHTAKIFRPDSYKEFPQVWYREKLTFYSDGSCSYLILASNDGHYFKNGIWELTGPEENIIQITDSSGSVYKKMLVHVLTPSLLKYEVIS